MFQKLKNLITEILILQFYDFEKLVQIETNASRLIIVEYLMQFNNNNKWCLVACYSKKMLPAEQNYNINNQKLLIIMACFDKWHVYIQSTKKTEIYINH